MLDCLMNRRHAYEAEKAYANLLKLLNWQAAAKPGIAEPFASRRWSVTITLACKGKD